MRAGSHPNWKHSIRPNDATAMLNHAPFRGSWIIAGQVVTRAEMRAFERTKWGKA